MNPTWREGLFSPPRNFGGLPPQAARFEEARVVILPVPYDSTTTYKTGTREGPQAIIDASCNMELYDQELDREIYLVGIHTLQEVEPVSSGPEAMVERAYQIAAQLLGAGKLVAMLGGEHSLTAGTVRAHKERYPDLSVLYLDAHADLRDAYLGARYNHACTARRAQEHCPVVHVGMRSLSREEQEFIRARDLVVFPAGASPLDDMALARLVSTLSPQVYVSVDLDVLDPAIMAAVGTPEPGGLTWQEVTRVLRTVARHRQIVGFDVMELAPREGPVACAMLAAQLTYKLIGYATAPAEAL